MAKSNVTPSSDSSQPIALRQFATYLRSEKGAAENTISNYLIDLRKFAQWLRCREKELAQVNRADIQEYLSDLMTAGLSPRSARRKLNAFQTFYWLLLDDETVRVNPTLGIPRPKIATTLPRVLSESDVDKMVAFAGSRKRKSGVAVRDRAILLTFYASGLRESELANLKLSDLDLDGGFVKIWNGKGGKDGIAPLSPPAIEALQEYLSVLRPKLDPDGESPFLFLSRLHKPLSRQSIFYMVRDVGKAVLGKKVSPHQLRHSCATALLRGGADTRDVQAVLRHADIDTTQIYVHTDLTYLRRIYERSHPRA